MKIITGPVVGHVSSEKVRFVIEFDTQDTVTVAVKPQSSSLQGKYTKTTQIRALSHRPVVAEFQDFAPGSYSYMISDRKRNLLFESTFTVPNPDSPLKMIVVSCNALHDLTCGDVDLWASMAEHHIKGDSVDVDMILHIGDQIYEYNREVWQRAYRYMICVQEGEGKTSGNKLMAVDEGLGFAGEWTAEDRVYTFKEVKEIITELYRSLYRQSWNHPPIKRILSMVSNQMVMDDHDIRNGWGIMDLDRNPETIEHAIGVCAHKAYQEYQVQLWRDIDDCYHVDYRTLVRGNTAVFLMDVRNPRTFCYHANSPYMGPEQMSAFENMLNDKKVDDLLVVCSIPIIMGTEKLTNIVSHFDVTYDIRDGWAEGNHRPEHVKVLNLLRDWKFAKEGRHLTLVGGDIHFGLHTVIADKEGRFVCNQVVTSPIATKPTTGFIGDLQDYFFGDSFMMYGLYKIKHDFRVHKRNYVEIVQTPDGWKHCFHTET